MERKEVSRGFKTPDKAGSGDGLVRTSTAGRDDRASRVGVESFLRLSGREEEEFKERQRLREQASRDQDRQAPGQDRRDDGNRNQSSVEVPQGGELKAMGDQPREAAIEAEALCSQISWGTSLDTLRARERSGQVSPGAMTYQSRSPHEQEPPRVITSSRGRPQTEDVRQGAAEGIEGKRIRKTEYATEDAREASYKAS